MAISKQGPSMRRQHEMTIINTAPTYIVPLAQPDCTPGKSSISKPQSPHNASFHAVSHVSKPLTHPLPTNITHIRHPTLQLQHLHRH